MKAPQEIKFGRIADADIAALDFHETTNKIESWILNQENNYVCVCNTHSVVTSGNDQLFHKALDNAGLCVPDGMPLVWALKAYGYKNQDRVDGPNLMLKLCELSALKGYKIFLYGGTDETLEALEVELNQRFLNVKIIGKYSPPFRKLEKNEEQEIIHMINSTKPDLVFVSLGCPKQEIWMFNHKDKIDGVMLGVGAAFEFIIGNIKRPPLVFQKLGLEWLFRLMSEPKRLWKRYAYNNPVYIYRFLKNYKKNKRYTIKQNNLQ
ncbi:glycosyltransferase [Bacillus cereus]|uniref:WecB/TagA/CpsF family glycosyltransferase n=1 Tax=Bacillus cereus TaxID=1396 RepID=UPI000BF3FF4C|nr:WecB/TagA/CpsF family glycosyltransferase [Bacillus cereus]PFR30837.1 glycosyltransferase [Bacillus cereus]